MNVGSLSSYVSGGSLGAFFGLWLAQRAMTLKRTADGIVADVDLFGWTKFTVDGLWLMIAVILVCALVGAFLGRAFRRLRLGK